MLNPEDFSRDDVLRDLSPLILSSVLAAALLIGFLTWLLRHKFPATRWVCRVVGVACVSTAFFSLFQLTARWLEFATAWPLLAVSLLAGLIWELILLLYEFEKTLVTPMRGRIILWFRLLALTTLILILAQPVFTYFKDRKIDREIAVLLDDSASMHLSDRQLSISEKLDRAGFFDHPEVIENRPPLRQIHFLLGRARSIINTEIDAIKTAPTSEAGFQARSGFKETFFQQIDRQFDEINSLVTSATEKRLLQVENLDSLLSELSDRYETAKNSANENNAKLYLENLDSCSARISDLENTVLALINETDQKLYQSFDSATQQSIDDLALKSRADLARKISTAILDKLANQYSLRYYRFNREVEEITSIENPEPVDETHLDSIRAQTDLTGALEQILSDSSPEVLAGIVMLSDGRHTAAQLPQDSLRQLAVQNSPLCSIPIGGTISPVDASIINLSAPESIYLNDRVVITAEAKFEGLRGEQVKAQLVHNNAVVSELKIDVTDISFRSELRFSHTPTDKGIIDYQVKIDIDERELFFENNHWNFKVAVTDDRTNVLLVDGYPRWEFRYLRNLFYGRDKSVHLQSVLLNPDTVSGLNRPPEIPADATRKFGDAEATELPQTPDDWQLFDIIILGDIKPNQLGSRDWEAINDAVTKRGSLLVCVAGPRHMPHNFTNQYLQNLLPVTYQQSNGEIFTSPESAYTIELTSAGRAHPLMTQSASRELNQQLWASFPPLRWRWASDTVKESAEVLAYASAIETQKVKAASKTTPNPNSVELAIKQLTEKKQRQKDNALVTTMRNGLGNVVLLNFDQTWRFRYGVGDTYHHRFWGQLARWGAGPNLRSGVETLRLGTDRLSYTPTDEIIVTTKVLDESRKPINDATIFANVIKDGKKVTRQEFSYRADSPGLYDTTFPGLTEPGEYQIELEGEAVDQIIANSQSIDSIATELLVLNTRNPIELAELTADRDFLHRAAQQTNGLVAELWELDKLTDAFGSPKQTLTERQNENLWDTWPFLGAFLGLLTAEWILRRTGGLV